MEVNLSVASLDPSATLAITSLTKKLKSQGQDVVNFAAGEPDFDTPDFIKNSGKAAIDEGFTKYTPSVGLIELRQAIAEKVGSENNISFDSNNVIVTTGAKYALFCAIFCLINPGEEVLLPSPYWVSYPQMVKLARGKLKVLPTLPDNNFKLTPGVLEKNITAKSKLLILNYPNNPTGSTLMEEDLKDICEIAKKHNLYVLSDEIYEKLIYDGKKHTSFASLPGAKDFTVTVNGMSKSFSMTGWRIGYLAANEKLVNEISKIIDHTTSCACSIAQKAALCALKEGDSWQNKIKGIFQERRDLLYQGLSGINKLSPFKPEGTFYLFCDIRGTGLSSFDFCSQLLEKHMVSCIPADSFGAGGFVRFSFAASLENIEKGIERIKKFIG
ncbi:MAG: pyridoxal phosphate-dependent aminotransferase [Candidatus Omnitrophota bacterium]